MCGGDRISPKVWLHREAIILSRDRRSQSQSRHRQSQYNGLALTLAGRSDQRRNSSDHRLIGASFIRRWKSDTIEASRTFVIES